MELIRFDPVFTWILRASLAALFATAAVHKIRDPRTFLHTFSDYEILPPLVTAPGAIVLVVAELSIAVALLIDPDAGRAGLAAASLLSIYTLAIAVNLLRGRRKIDCGCFGPAHRQPLAGWLVLRNAVLAMAAAAICLPISDRSLHLLDGLSLLGGFLTLALLFNAINVLAAESAPWPEPESLS